MIDYCISKAVMPDKQIKFFPPFQRLIHIHVREISRNSPKSMSDEDICKGIVTKADLVTFQAAFLME